MVAIIPKRYTVIVVSTHTEFLRLKVMPFLDQGLFEDIGLRDICGMTDLQAEQLDDFTPSELQIVIQKCKGLNPDFCGMRKRVLASALKSRSLD
jgi:hypothetical protein